MPQDDTAGPDFIFLGIAQRASYHHHGVDITGLSHALLLPFFPIPLTGQQCIIGIRTPVVAQLMSRESAFTCELVLTDSDNPTVSGWTTLGFITKEIPHERFSNTSGEPQITVPDHEMFQMRLLISSVQNHENDPYSYHTVILPAPAICLSAPTTVLVDIKLHDKQYRLGSLCAVFAPAPAITDEERKAIASRPTAVKAVHLVVKCNACGEEYHTYATLDPKVNVSPDLQQLTRLDLSPDAVKCKCAEKDLDLRYLKEGVHAVFRHRITDFQGSTISPKPLYEIAEIKQLTSAYAELITSDPREEDVQSFIESNPLLWHFLAPSKVISKPAILTKHKADFGILTFQGILYLVEIEKPQSKIVGSRGKLHSNVQTAFDQVRDWSVVIDDHRQAVLACMELRPEEVCDIRFIVIAGLARNVPMGGLTKLQRNLPTANTQFYCFDDLTSFLHGLQQHLANG